MDGRIVKWSIRGLLACLALSVVVYAGMYGYRYWQYRAELAIYHELGYPTNMEELRAWEPVDDPALNAAIPIHEAIDKINYDYSDELLLLLSGFDEVDVGPTELYRDEVIRDIGIVLDLNREALDILHSSNHQEDYRPKVFDLFEVENHLESAASARVLTRLLAEESIQ